MTINTTSIINSLEDYVLDIKPYHSKLSEIIVEFAFFDDVKVQFGEEHTISALLSSIWSRDYISNPPPTSSRYLLPAPFSVPSFFHYSNQHLGTSFESGIKTEFNYKLYDQRYRKEVKLVRQKRALYPDNPIPQLEGHDFFQTKGAYSFTVLPGQKYVQAIHYKHSPIAWATPDSGDNDYSTMNLKSVVHYSDPAKDVFDRISLPYDPSNVLPSGDDLYIHPTTSWRTRHELGKTVFQLFHVSVLEPLNKYTIKIETIGPNPTFSIYRNDESVPVITVNDNIPFSTPEFSGTIRAGSQFNTLVNSNNFQNYTLVFGNETWTLIKVNPVGYSRPMMRLNNAPTIEVYDVSPTIINQNWTITCTAPNVFTVVGFVNGPADDTVNYPSVGNSVKISGVEQFKFNLNLPKGTHYTPILGDYFTFNLHKKFPKVDFVPNAGYDIGDYDALYDDRKVNANISAFSSKYTNVIVELEALNETQFIVRYFDKFDYIIGVKTEIHLSTVTRLATVGVVYADSVCSFKIDPPYVDVPPPDMFPNPDGDEKYGTGDLFIIDPNLMSDESFKSKNMPFIHIYGASFTDIDFKRWIFTASQIGTSGSFEFDKAFDNGETHFTVHSSLIKIDADDAFWFDVIRDKPSYKVIGSMSGEYPMAVVGKKYDNNRIRFTIKPPVAKVSHKITRGPGDITEVSQQVLNYNGFVTSLDGKYLKFDRSVRSDAPANTYKFRFDSQNNAFAVTSETGIKIGVDYSSEYEWTDRYNNSALSQNPNFDVKHADGNIAFTVLKNFNGSPVVYPNNYEFYVNIIDQSFPLYHSFDGVMFNWIKDDDTMIIEDLTEDRMSLFINSTSINIPSVAGKKSSTYLETNDTLTELPSYWNSITKSQRGLDSFIVGGEKRNEIGLITKRSQEFADIGTADIDVYLASKPTFKVGKVRQKDSNLRSTIQFETDFINAYMGPIGTKFSIKVDQGQAMNTRTNAKIIDSVKFTEKIGVDDSEIYGGYDTLAYDDEENDLNFRRGGPEDPDNDDVRGTDDPTYDSVPSYYDKELVRLKFKLLVEVEENFTLYSIHVVTGVTAIVQMNKMIDADRYDNHPLHGKIYLDGLNEVPYHKVAYTHNLGLNVPGHGNMSVSRIEIDHPFGTDINKVMLVDDLINRTLVPATIEFVSVVKDVILPSGQLTTIASSQIVIIPMIPGNYTVIIV